MFVYIDLIGYLPGAVAYRQARGGHIWHGFYVFHHLADHWIRALALLLSSRRHTDMPANWQHDLHTRQLDGHGFMP